jgi:hypothetical protein
MEPANKSFAWMPLLLAACLLAFVLTLLFPIIFFAQTQAQSQSVQPSFTYGAPLRGPDGALLTPTPTPTPIPAPSHVTFSIFVGSWYAHLGTLDIEANGHAHLALQGYSSCSDPEVKLPCKTLITEEIVFTRVIGRTAYGTIIQSSDGDSGKVITATLGDNDTLDLSDGGFFCGPKSPLGWCGA